MKLSAVRTIVRGKRVVLVDDSIVRGTTSRRIVTMLKEAGATEVHVRIASPPMTNPCFYGVDTSTYDRSDFGAQGSGGRLPGNRGRLALFPLARGAAQGRQPQGALHGLLHGAVPHGAVPVARRGEPRDQVSGPGAAENGNTDCTRSERAPQGGARETGRINTEKEIWHKVMKRPA